MRNTFVESVCRQAETNKNLYLISGDLGYNVLNKFWEKYPDAFFNAGISEQNMSSVAAGLALEGKEVYTYSIANFSTLRCLEQIRNDIAYHNLKVRIAAVGSGFAYGTAGMTHHATEDIAVMRSLPNMMVFSPADKFEVIEIIKAISDIKGPCYLRLGKGGEPILHDNGIQNYTIGKAIQIFDGQRIAIFSTGSITSEAKKATVNLNILGISTALYSFPTIKPIDRTTIEECGRNCEFIITVEEHNLSGGFGSAVAEVLSEANGKKAVLHRIGIEDVYTSTVGDQDYLRQFNGLDAHSIECTIRGIINL